MPLVESDGRWLSAHIYFKGQVFEADCDAIVLNVVAPFVRRCQQQGWITKHFFIRYGEERGLHVRLRLYGDRELLRREVRPALETHVHDTLPAALKAYPHRAGGVQETSSPDDAPVLWIPYEPEVDRYGGPEGVAVAETFFHYSSEAALALLEHLTDRDRSARLGKGLLAMVVLIYAFLPNRAAAIAFISTYSTGYLRTLAETEKQQIPWMAWFVKGFDEQAETLLPYVKAAWERLEAGQSLTETLDHYYRHLCPLRQRLEALHADNRLITYGVRSDTWRQSVEMILPSYLHMMNNRLGLSFPEESYLAYVMTRTLLQIMAQDAPEPSMTVL